MTSQGSEFLTLLVEVDFLWGRQPSGIGSSSKEMASVTPAKARESCGGVSARACVECAITAAVRECAGTDSTAITARTTTRDGESATIATSSRKTLTPPRLVKASDS